MAEPEPNYIQIDGKKYEPPGDFTIGEAEVIKEASGLTPQELIARLREDATDPNVLRPLAWAVIHRENPKIEIDDPVITNAYIGAMWVGEEAPANGVPPNRASRRKTSSSPGA